MELEDVDAIDPGVEQPAANPVETSEEAGEAAAALEDASLDLTDESTDDGPTVDALESQLRDLQGAMDQLQSGDLDGAERTIEALEQSVGGTRD